MITMLLIRAALLVLAIAVQRKLVDTDWDPSPGRERPLAAGGAVTVGRSYPKIRRRRGEAAAAPA